MEFCLFFEENLLQHLIHRYAVPLLLKEKASLNLPLE